MDEFPSNSRRPPTGPINDAPKRPDEPTFEPVVTGKVIRRKKSIGRRLKDTFFSEQGGVFVHLIKEVLVPALQATVTDMVVQGIQRAVYGDAAPTNRGYRGSMAQRTHISYDRPSTVRPVSTYAPQPAARRAATQPSAMDIGEIILADKIQIQHTMDKMLEAVEQFAEVTVANLKELIGETPLYTDHKYGWDEQGLESMKAERVREGYLLVLDNPIALRR